jgi:predicted component of type VI protein secretion system
MVPAREDSREEGYAAVDFVLIQVQSDGGTKPAVVNRSRTLIGRQTGCHVRIRSGEVSREHCEIVVQEGSAVVRDKGSRNGTFVNGVKIVEKRLEAGDLLAVGPLVFLVQLGGQPGSFDAAQLHRAGQPGAGGHGASRKGKHDGAPADGAPTSAGFADELGDLPTGADDSSVVDFEFDFGDDEDEQRSQPPL